MAGRLIKLYTLAASEQGMIEKKTYTSEFENRYGEKWIFEYDYTSGKAFLKGSDVDNQSYPVVDCRAQDLILNNEEILWLRSVWANAISS